MQHTDYACGDTAETSVDDLLDLVPLHPADQGGKVDTPLAFSSSTDFLGEAAWVFGQDGHVLFDEG